MKCIFCEEQLEDIRIGGSIEVWLSDRIIAALFVCTSRDCKNCGVVLAIPSEPSED